MAETNFNHAGGGGYNAASQPRNDRVMYDLRRNWKRHPALRAQYRNFKHYCIDVKHNTVFM